MFRAEWKLLPTKIMHEILTLTASDCQGISILPCWMYLLRVQRGQTYGIKYTVRFEIMNGIVSLLIATLAYLDFELRAMAATDLAVPGLVKKPKIQIKNMRWNAIKSTSVKPRQCKSSPLSPRTSRKITRHQHNRCKTLNGRHFCCADAPVCAPEALEASHPSSLSLRPFEPKIAHPRASTGIVTSFVLTAS